MSTEEDRMVLAEYATWRDQEFLAGDEVRLGIDRFLEQREAEFDKRRVEDALTVTDRAMAGYENVPGPMELDGDDADRFYRALLEVQRTLIDDRPYVDDRRFSDATPRRVFT